MGTSLLAVSFNNRVNTIILTFIHYLEMVDCIGRKVSLMVSGAVVVLGAVIQSAAVQGASW